MKNPMKRIRSTASTAIAYPSNLRTTIMELFDIGPWIAFTALAIAGTLLVAAIVYFIRSAPPSTITITSGPEGSAFFKNAGKYAKILERNGVKMNILVSNGSIQNLERLNDPKAKVDVGIAQTGPISTASERLVSLGSISYQPLLIFYRGKKLDYLSELKGKRIAIGPVGSGTRNVALAVLGANDIKEGGETTLMDWDADDAQTGLKENKIDAAFVMNESASSEILRSLIRSKEIHLFDFKQANAYSRKFEYLNVLELPEGTINIGLNLPPKDLTLIGPTVELIASKDLHPALVDLLVEAAMEVHARPGLFQKRGEFPMAVEHAIHLSEDAAIYYKSGKGFLYRTFPYWLANLLSRIFVAFLPLLVILIPLMKSVPEFFRWMTRLRIRRRYRELRLLEQRILGETRREEKELLRQEFDRIEERVNKMQLRASFADQFYGLRLHIDYVRKIVENAERGKPVT